MRIFIVAGTRPNFVKLAPLHRELSKIDGIELRIVHTGQHSDYDMSGAFFKDLNIPKPDHNLGVFDTKTHSEQTGRIMIQFENLCTITKPDLVILIGDVNSTLACALAVAKMPNRPYIAHYEAGLRSFDRTMPEEINRVITDSLSDFLWVHDEEARSNLFHEGLGNRNIRIVGPTQIDTIEMFRDKIEAISMPSCQYGVVTLHRPSNVDDPNQLALIIHKILNLTAKYDIVFPMHPRTRKMIDEHMVDWMREDLYKNVFVINPRGYLEFMAMVKNAKFVITDSGGLQEEAAYFNVNTFTLRDTTERPLTISRGSNRLANMEDIHVPAIEWEPTYQLDLQPLYDGKTCQRVREEVEWIKNTYL